MARIRTIKPEFWTDEKLMECSLSSRLLLIGILNFADDQGNIEAGTKGLKCKIFPSDNIEIQPLLNQLLGEKILIPYTVNNEKYFNIKNFHKHQIINRISKPRCPLYGPLYQGTKEGFASLTEESYLFHSPLMEDSLSTHGTLTEDSRSSQEPAVNKEITEHSRMTHGGLITEGKGREGKGKEGSKPVVEDSKKTESRPGGDVFIPETPAANNLIISSDGKYKYTKKDFDFVTDMRSDRRKVDPNFKFNSSREKGANSLRMLREIDGRTWPEIHVVWDWARNDDFWKTVILSPGKLRERFSDIKAKMGRKSTKASGSSGRYVPKEGEVAI